MRKWKFEGLAILTLAIGGCQPQIEPKVIEIDKPTLVTKPQPTKNDTVIEERGERGIPKQQTASVQKSPSTKPAKGDVSEWVGFTPAEGSSAPASIPQTTPKPPAVPQPATSPIELKPATHPSTQAAVVAIKPPAMKPVATQPAVVQPATTNLIAVTPPSTQSAPAIPATVSTPTTAPARIVPATAPASMSAGATLPSTRPTTSTVSMGIYSPAPVTKPTTSPTTIAATNPAFNVAATTASTDPRQRSVAGLYFAIGTPLVLILLWLVFREKPSR